MKMNMPVTKQEVELTETSSIVSKTDLKGRITYINRDFIEISGFLETELIGKSHNIVRHPDMPPEGKPWNGIVKNRCKNGDYYWVEANVAPIREGGKVTGYMSVRAKPSRQQIDAADALYAEMRAGNMPQESAIDAVMQRVKDLPYVVKAGVGVLLPMLAVLSYDLIAGAEEMSVLAVATVGGIASLVSMFGLNRFVVTPLTKANQAINAIADGDFKYVIDTKGNDELGKMMQALKAMQIRIGFDVNDARKTQEETSKLQTALDNSTSAFTFVDSAGRLSYMNATAKALWEAMAVQVKEAHPDFDEANMIGLPIVQYFEKDEDKRVLSAQLDTTKTVEVSMYGLKLTLTLVPVYSENNEYLGRMTQWVDHTAEDVAEKEVMRLVSEAIAGNLSERVDTDILPTGFVKETGVGINQILDAVITPLNVAADYVENISKGKIPAEITDEYNGDFNAIKHNLNQCITSINTLISEMNHMSAEHDAGDIDVKIDEAKFEGAYAEMAKGVNEMVFGHIAVKKQAMACIKGFGEGDFNAPMAQLPGKKAFINDTIEQVRSNLTALSRDAVMLADAARDGEISTRADANQHQGDFRQIVEGVNNTLDLIVEPIATVKEAIETITTAANEISTGNNDLSSRTEQQASSLEETAASMEEIASTVKQNADNAQQANQLALTASDVAVKGGDVVGEVVSTMSGINDSARKIEDIISVIDGIAFQTNILALNAAVEAARAGEQGRGFAVVAGEVRNLAQRSASAAKEIKELIADSVSKTTEGTKLVEGAGATMEEVVTSVQRVTDIISEISAASQEQTTGINQVNEAVTSMDETTQQNAALVEEAAAAAESLVEQAVQLSDVVSVFKVGGAPSQERRASNSPMRSAAPKPVKQSKGNNQGSSKPGVSRSTDKTGTDDGDWEEF